MDIEKYNKIHDEIMKRLKNSEITTEQAKDINDLAFEKYVEDYTLYEEALLLESMNDDDYGDDFYYESSKVIKNLKTKLNKVKKSYNKHKKEKVNTIAVHKAFKTYVKAKTIAARIKQKSKKSDFKKSDKYTDLKKKLRDTIKEYIDLQKGLNRSEKELLIKLTVYFNKSFDKSSKSIFNGGSIDQAAMQANMRAIQQASMEHQRFMQNMQFQNQQFMNNMHQNNLTHMQNVRMHNSMF